MISLRLIYLIVDDQMSDLFNSKYHLDLDRVVDY